MHQRRPRAHLPEDDQRTIDRLCENFRPALPQTLRTHPLPKDAYQLPVGHRPPERIQRGEVA